MNKINEAAQRVAKQNYILKGPPPDTFSATHPAYAGTVLEAGRRGIPPYGATKKICMICRRKYLVDEGRKQCVCGGYLYTTNDYYHPKGKGGDAGGKEKDIRPI